jgi:hypothetical protein
MTAIHSIAPTLLVTINISKHRHEVLIGIPGKTRRLHIRSSRMFTVLPFRRDPAGTVPCKLVRTPSPSHSL